MNGIHEVRGSIPLDSTKHFYERSSPEGLFSFSSPALTITDSFRPVVTRLRLFVTKITVRARILVSSLFEGARKTNRQSASH